MNTVEPASLLHTSGVIIEASGIRLRPLGTTDADDIVAGCADPLTQRFMPGLPNPYTRANALWWINEGAPAAWAAGGAGYAIADPTTDRLLGGIALMRVTMERQQGEIGYWVAPWARGRGVARGATAALTNWAFARGFARLELLTCWENEASQRVAIAAGYRREGVRRQALAGRDGSRYDAVAWSRLPGDPAEPEPRLLPDLPGGSLSDEVVVLRPLRATDADTIYRLHALPDVVATSVPPATPSRAEIDLRCARSGARWLAGERADLVILDAASGAIAGSIGLYYQEPATAQAMIGYCLFPAWRRRGYATRAARLLAHWALHDVGIGRLIAGAAPGNLGSQRVLEKAGFRREGLLRGRLPGQHGRRVDDLLFARLPQDPVDGP